MMSVDSGGVFRNGLFYVDTGAPGYQSEQPYHFGLSGDLAVSGDWNGDGRDQLGVFRNGTFYLQGLAPISFGLPGDRPIVGDWDGDGKDQVGVFRSGPGGNGWFFLDVGARGFQGTDPLESKGFFFGFSSDQPVAGDWNGDGRDEVGVFRNGLFFLDVGERGYQGEQPIAFGLPGDRATAGDWDGDGKDQVGVFRNGAFFRDLGAPGYQGETPIAFGLPGDQPLSGKWSELVLGRHSYDYVPSVVYDGAKYRMWWCGGVAGDYILYSEAPTPDGSWQSPTIALKPTGRNTDFDGQHVCDPSVIKVGGTYYMYYGAFPNDASNLPKTTMIGVATSQNGVTWQRPTVLNGQPIVRPNGDYRNVPNPYGAGQPSAIYLNGYVYLVYNDTTGKASNPVNGNAMYVIRSTDPLFRGPVQELTANGFVTRSSTQALTTQYKLFDAASVDWTYDAVSRSFIVAVNGVHNQTALLVYNEAFQLRRTIAIPNVAWTEGPGLARRWDGQSLVRRKGSSQLPLEIFYSTGVPGIPESWDLAFTRFDAVI